MKETGKLIGMAAILALAAGAALFARWSVRKAEDSAAFLLSLKIATEEPISAVRLDYSVAGKPAGSGVVRNPDGTLLWPGDTVTRDFIPSDFPAGADLSTFSFTVAVENKSGDSHSVGEPVRFCPAYGGWYDYSLTGSEKNGFAVLPEITA